MDYFFFEDVFTEIPPFGRSSRYLRHEFCDILHCFNFISFSSSVFRMLCKLVEPNGAFGEFWKDFPGAVNTGRADLDCAQRALR